MVFQTVVNFVRSRGPDEFWRKRRMFKLASVCAASNKHWQTKSWNALTVVAFCTQFHKYITENRRKRCWMFTFYSWLQHFIGRRRNCYSITVRNVHRALQYATKGRALKKADMKDVSIFVCQPHASNLPRVSLFNSCGTSELPPAPNSLAWNWYPSGRHSVAVTSCWIGTMAISHLHVTRQYIVNLRYLYLTENHWPI